MLQQKPQRTIKQKLTEKAIVGGGTLLTGGVLDLLGHGGTGGLAVAAVATVLTVANSDDVAGIARSFIGVGDALETTATAQHVIDKTLADVPKHPDQRAISKLKRLVGIPTPALPEPHDEIQDEEEVPIYDATMEEALPEFDEDAPLYTLPARKPLGVPSASSLIRPALSDAPIQTVPRLSVRASIDEREILLAETLGLDVDEIIEAGAFITGMKGSGKSTVAARLMEQTGRFPLPQVIFDIKGDFVSLVDSHFMNGMVMTQEQQYDARTIYECRLQVVVDLRTWETMEERAQVIAGLTSSLLKYAMSVPEEDRIPWLVHLDEAQQYVPQQQPVGIERATWKAVTQAIMNVGVLGRAYGGVPFLYTQRIATVHKDVISQPELRIFMKASLDNDLDRYEEYINTRTAKREDIQAFRAGDAVVILPDGRQFIVHFLDRESRHGSHTPHLTQALRVAPRQRYPMPIREEIPSAEPEVHPMPVREQVASYPSARPYVHPTSQLSPELQRALKAWQAGHSSVTKLEKALKITHHQAYKLFRQLHDHRLI